MILFPLSNSFNAEAERIDKGVSIFREALYASTETPPADLYHRLIQARQAFNALFHQAFDCYIEDEWNEYVEGEIIVFVACEPKMNFPHWPAIFT
jgi:hypothetical protein